ncbi:hypothetical protein L0Z36_05515 [Burkholderia multivorans]|uniref:hypothetical protein n=1 Tax=Burkholderia multivorans TaxID=87883 RepID=UPI00201967CB|nr:hypothetical protein [Burkholderia multivorans]UQP01393.1 hypothetical protein L0Z36_05515 [Burkholderia multivorans]
MPGIKIPVYEQQITPGLDVPMARMPLGTPDMGGIGRGLEAAGAGAAAVGDVLRKQQMQDEQAAVARQLGNDRVTWLQNMQTAKDNAAPGAPDFTPNFIKGFDDYAQQQLQQMADGPAKRFYTLQLNDLRTSLAGQAITWQAEQHRSYNVSQYQQGNDAAARAIAMDPNLYGATRASQLALIDAAQIDPQTKAKLVENFKDVASTAAGMRMVSNDPAAALGVMTQKPDQPLPAGYEWVGDLPPQKLTAFQSHARALVAQQQNAADRAQLAADNAAVDARNKAIDIWMKGQQFSPEYEQQLMAIAKGTSEEQSMRELIALARRSAGFASMSLPQQQAELDRMHAKASTPGQGVDTIESKYIDQIQTMHSQAVTDYKANPWEATSSRGAIKGLQTAPITNEQDAIQVIKSRASIIGSVEAYGQNGSPVSPLQPIEAKQLGDYLERLPAAQRGQAINDIGFAIGNAGRIGALADQLDHEHRIDRLALLAGASQLTAQNGQRISSLIYQGAEAIRDKRAGIDDKLLQGVTALASAQLREAFPSATAAQDAIDTTKYLYAYGAAKNNVSNASVDATQLDASISGATGGVVDLNGRKTLKPYGWDDTRFNSSVQSIGAANIVTPISDGKVHIGQTEVPVADFAAKLPSARLVRVSPQGVYAVTAGTGYATNSQKQPILIRLK